ncbi:hypothetical protein SAMN02982929_04368 [Saccharopolyspora kobensis]|uniref:Uncharacterized protein n=1 Tax=Saccharopolyspora kobensis TaxID=146035 RepID=A0A1H6DHA3_9PSEU|nr:hypothetical protein SAMN02982929_04368 [Saccharopolyspora kobensis]SFD29868.1 hypothetical protein SAMN05216506_103423 [Saccharopolyspora kobensis]
MTEDGKPVADEQSGGGTPPNPPQQPEQPTAGPARGQIRHQDAESTTPREPTLAEQRARIAAEKRREEKHRAELEAAEQKSQKRRRIMIGGGVTVGVVALVAAMYSASEVSNEANASEQYCATDQSGQPGVRDQDDFCNEQYVHSHGGHVTGGMFFMPIFLPSGMPSGNYNSYRYAYTPAGVSAPPVGSPATGSSFTKPTGSTIKDTSGKTIQRGGFGINNKSGSSGS